MYKILEAESPEALTKRVFEAMASDFGTRRAWRVHGAPFSTSNVQSQYNSCSEQTEIFTDVKFYQAMVQG